MLSQEQQLRLEKTDPLLLNTSQQCAYVLKCLEAGMQPPEILETKFRGEIVTFDVIMKLLAEYRLAWQDKSGNWHTKKKR